MKKSHTGLDPQEIYVHAYSFQWSSERLRNPQHIEPEEVGIISFPSMVLSAFSCELYFKCLICLRSGEVPDIHNLNDLFHSLEPGIQVLLTNRWNAWINEPAQLQTLEFVEE